MLHQSEHSDGGGGGIRTHGRGLPYSDFQDRRLQPLGHPSEGIAYNYTKWHIILKSSSF